MKQALRRFESALRQLLEGAIGGLFGTRTQPVDLARRLAEHMEDQRTVGAGRSYVPNNFRVYLAPETLSKFAAFESGLEDDLAAYLGGRAEESGLHFVGRVRVTLLADPQLRSDRMRVESDLVDRRGVVLQEGGQQTQAMPLPASEAPAGAPAMLLEAGRRRLSLAGLRRLEIGRALDNGLILDSSSVSRHHARLTQRGEHWTVEDLGSTHGTFVNGQRVQSSVLRPGDRLQLGEQILRLLDPYDASSDEAAQAGPDSG